MAEFPRGVWGFMPPGRHSARAVSTRIALCMLAARLFAADSLTLRVATETAPAGGSVQVKVSLSEPALVASGTIAIDFDPAVFGEIAHVAVFSAAGDAMGYANVRDRHVDAHFQSRSGGIGRLAALPVFVVSVPVLTDAPPGAAADITIDPAGSAWKDPQGKEYPVTANPGKFTVGGRLSIRSVTPGGGLLPEGTVIEISGAGFEPATKVAIDGVSLSSVRFVSPERIDITLGGPTEMTAKHVRVENPDGESADYYAALPSAPSNSIFPYPGIHPIVPLSMFQRVEIGGTLGNPLRASCVAFLNQNPVPVELALRATSMSWDRFIDTITIPSGSLYFLDAEEIARGANGVGWLFVNASMPIRMLVYESSYYPRRSVGVSLPAPLTLSILPVQLDVSPFSLSWSLQKGTSPPATGSLDLRGRARFSVSVPAEASRWLSATPENGTLPVTLVVKADPSAVNPGTYSAKITIAPVLPGPLSLFAASPAEVPVSLAVSAGPLISGPPFVNFTTIAGGAPVGAVKSPDGVTVAVQ